MVRAGPGLEPAPNVILIIGSPRLPVQSCECNCENAKSRTSNKRYFFIDTVIGHKT